MVPPIYGDFHSLVFFNSAGEISGASLDVGSGTIQTTGTVSGGTLSGLLGNVT